MRMCPQNTKSSLKPFSTLGDDNGCSKHQSVKFYETSRQLCSIPKKTAVRTLNLLSFDESKRLFLKLSNSKEIQPTHFLKTHLAHRRE